MIRATTGTVRINELATHQTESALPRILLLRRLIAAKANAPRALTDAIKRASSPRARHPIISMGIEATAKNKIDMTIGGKTCLAAVIFIDFSLYYVALLSFL